MGSRDTHVYALHADNGTMIWRYKTGGWIYSSPCLSEDGNVSKDRVLSTAQPSS
jgi:outer membrane protein assembly factor BamB